MTDPTAIPTDARGEEFEPPTPELVASVLLRTGDLQHRRVFYDALENPLWVAVLDQRGAFTPPEPVVGDDGTLRSPPWPEGDFLVRVAERVPDEVAAVLAQHLSTKNFYVQRSILRAAARLPAGAAARLSDGIAAFFPSPYGWWLEPSDVVALIRSLAAGGEDRKALRLAHAVYRPQAPDRSPGAPGDRSGVRLAGQDVVVGLDAYWYQQTLPEVVAALSGLGARALSTVAAWLEQYQVATGAYDPDTGQDLSYVWRPSIAPHQQNQDLEDVGDGLVDAVRDLALAQVRGGRPLAEVAAALEQSGQPLLRRIGLHVITTHLTETGAPEALAAATDQLLRRKLLTGAYWHEYARLARATLSRLGPAEQERWSELVASEPAISDDDLRQHLATHDQAPENVDPSELARYRDWWRLRLLAAVGRSSLPAPQQHRLDELTAALGPVEHPEFPTYFTSFAGPVSPLPHQALAEMGVDQLLEHLRTWRPEPGPGFGPSVEGQAGALTELAKADPGPLAERAIELQTLPISYVTASLRGFEEALGEHRPFPWRQVLALARHVAAQPDDGHESLAREDGEVVWRFAQRQVASLLERAVGAPSGGLMPEHAPAALGALAPLTTHPDPTPAHEERYSGTNMDPLTLSLNSVRPVALRAVVAHLRWYARLHDDPDARSWSDQLAALRSEGLRLLEARLGPGADQSLAVAAVFGQALGTLLWVDQEWVHARLPRLLGAANEPDGLDDHGRAYADTVWSVFLAAHHPAGWLLEALRPYFVRAAAELSTDRQVTIGWQTTRGPRERLADHLLTLHMVGSLSRDDELVQDLFTTAPVALRADALGHLGFDFLHATAVPEEVLARACALWEWRAAEAAAGRTDPAELDGFYWWVRSGRFDATWWLPRLAQAAASPTFDPHGMLGQRLADAARTDPARTLDVLELLLGRHEESWRRYDLVEHAPAVLAAALDANDGTLTERAETLMNRLGREGHLNLGQLVGNLRGR